LNKSIQEQAHAKIGQGAAEEDRGLFFGQETRPIKLDTNPSSSSMSACSFSRLDWAIHLIDKGKDWNATFAFHRHPI
jgi:hypothetical protein